MKKTKTIETRVFYPLALFNTHFTKGTQVGFLARSYNGNGDLEVLVLFKKKGQRDAFKLPVIDLQPVMPLLSFPDCPILFREVKRRARILKQSVGESLANGIIAQTGYWHVLVRPRTVQVSLKLGRRVLRGTIASRDLREAGIL